jgi:hypothetical protein
MNVNQNTKEKYITQIQSSKTTFAAVQTDVCAVLTTEYNLQL